MTHWRNNMEYEIRSVKLTKELAEKWTPLFKQNFNENKESHMEYSIQIQRYVDLDESDQLLTFGVFEKGTENVVGYNMFIVQIHPQHGLLSAHQEVIYISPEHRGLGPRLIRWSDKELDALGIKVIYYILKSKSRMSGALRKFGYEETERIYVKYLGV